MRVLEEILKSQKVAGFGHVAVGDFVFVTVGPTPKPGSKWDIGYVEAFRVENGVKKVRLMNSDNFTYRYVQKIDLDEAELVEVAFDV